MVPASVAVRLPNWVGDVCMALPALHLLLETGCRLHLLGRGWTRELLAGMGGEVHDLPRGLWSAARVWRSVGASEGILLTNSFHSALQARIAGVRVWGYRSAGRNVLLRRSLSRPRDRCHEVEVLHQLALTFCLDHELTFREKVPSLRLELPLHPEHRRKANFALNAARLNQPFIVVAPLAAGTIRGRSKAWPGFSELTRQLGAEGHRLVICPGPGEEGLAHEITPVATPLNGLSLGAYAAVCAQARLVIGNDSGPCHLAAAVNAPVLSVFGLGEPWRTAPWGGAWVGSDSAWPDVPEVLAACKGLLDLPSRDIASVRGRAA